MTVRAMWTGLIRFASVIEVVIEKVHASDLGLGLKTNCGARLVWIAQFFSYHKRKQEPYILSSC
jgi:hypothetical protein